MQRAHVIAGADGGRSAAPVDRGRRDTITIGRRPPLNAASGGEPHFGIGRPLAWDP